MARVVVLALVVGLGINHVWWSIADWHLLDMNAYWNAGLRLRTDGELYPPVTDVLASEVYRYSPWFAWMWVPLTYLPREIVNVVWSAVLVAASLAAVWPMVQRRAWIVVAFFLPILIGISAGGNVHAALIAALVLSVEGRSGPLWIGVAASLKVFPLLLVLTYLGRREWLKGAAAVGITALLAAPYLAYDLTHYVTTAGGAEMLSQWIPVYVVAVAVAAVAAVRVASSPFAWLASATAVALALPRFFVYDVTYVAIGLASTSSDQPSSSR